LPGNNGSLYLRQVQRKRRTGTEHVEVTKGKKDEKEAHERSEKQPFPTMVTTGRE